MLFPGHLNLNGDYGNLQVIAKQLEWRAMPYEIVQVESEAALASNLDFILVGHGSNAAWQSIRDQLASMGATLCSLIASGTPGLCVSSGFEELVNLSVLPDLTIKALPERVSRFVVETDGALEVLGYLNTDVDLPNLHREQQFVCTMLHGPVLAKNPGLLDEMLRSISEHANLELRSIQENEKAGQLADLVDEVWKLEKELASE